MSARRSEGRKEFPNLGVDLIWKLKVNPVCTRECLDYNVVSHEKPWGTREMRTICVKFDKKLADFSRLAARTQSATGSCEKLE